MKKIIFLITASMLLCILSGCTRLPSSEENFVIDLVAYLDYDDSSFGAYILSLDISESTFDLSQDVLFRISGEMGWLSIYPLSFSDKSLVLPYAPVGEPEIEYTVVDEYEQYLYSEDYVLIYDDENSWAEVRKNNQVVAELSLTSDDMHFTPHAFFVDDEGRIALLCNTIGNTFDKVNPFTMIYTKDNESYQIEMINNHTSIFDDYVLSKVNMPNCTGLETNVYGNAQSKTFLWNESANIVEINPYDGSVNVRITVDKINEDMPNLDTHREFYEFFTGVGYQNGVYLAKFPNYNNLAGTIVALYNSNGDFLGSVLCTEDSVSLLSEDNTEVDCVENTMIKPVLYIPQGNLH